MYFFVYIIYLLAKDYLNYYKDIKWDDIIHLPNGTFEWKLIDKRLRDRGRTPQLLFF